MTVPCAEYPRYLSGKGRKMTEQEERAAAAAAYPYYPDERLGADSDQPRDETPQ